MKTLLSAFLLISSSLFAASIHEVKKMTHLLNQPGPNAASDCGIETKTPTIRKGEVKIAYNCEDFPVPLKKVDVETISFYTNKAHAENGLILRSRVNQKDPTQSDVTVKFRPVGNEPIALEKLLYESLKKKSDEAKDVADATGAKEALELKCEADVALGPKTVNSCSLTTTTADLTADHQAFSQMATSGTLKKKLSQYPSVKINAQSWKIDSKDFKKGISIERWEVKNKKNKTLCLLEVSAKFEVEKDPESDLARRVDAEAAKALAKLAKTFPDKKPNPEQGNKTGRSLDFAASKSK